MPLPCSVVVSIVVKIKPCGEKSKSKQPFAAELYAQARALSPDILQLVDKHKDVITAKDYVKSFENRLQKAVSNRTKLQQQHGRTAPREVGAKNRI